MQQIMRHESVEATRRVAPTVSSLKSEVLIKRIGTIVNQEKIFTFELPWPAAAEVFGVLELAPAVRKQASALHKHLKGANLYLDYYRGTALALLQTN